MTWSYLYSVPEWKCDSFFMGFVDRYWINIANCIKLNRMTSKHSQFICWGVVNKLSLHMFTLNISQEKKMWLSIINTKCVELNEYCSFSLSCWTGTLSNKKSIILFDHLNHWSDRKIYCSICYTFWTLLRLQSK